VSAALADSDTAAGQATCRVLIVDDSAFMRRLVSEMVQAIPGFTVAGFARDGVDALAQISRLAPDVVTLDLEMPQLDGMTVLARVMSAAPVPVVVLSAGGNHYEDATLRALELGAVDFVRKPSGAISLDLELIRDRLTQALRAAARAGARRPAPMDLSLRAARRAAPLAVPVATHVVVVAASTGGPRALAEIIPALPAALPAAIVVAQHLPRDFTASLAARLDRASHLHVAEAHDGMVPYAGSVYIAPGAMHTRVGGTRERPILTLHAAARDPGAVAPSADVLFRSAAAVFGRAVTGVVLTGMGRDGADGLREVRRAGGYAIVQDQESSTIYGMPRAALSDAGADRVVPLSGVARTIEAAVGEAARERGPGERDA